MDPISDADHGVLVGMTAKRPKETSDMPDAPEGKAWKCPDCGCLATLGGNAVFHAVTKHHGSPTIVDQPPVEGRQEPPDDTRRLEWMMRRSKTHVTRGIIDRRMATEAKKKGKP